MLTGTERAALIFANRLQQADAPRRVRPRDATTDERAASSDRAMYPGPADRLHQPQMQHVDLHALMLRQNQLMETMMQQNMRPGIHITNQASVQNSNAATATMAQTSEAASHFPAGAFTDPAKAINSFDPLLQPMLKEWTAYVRSTASALATQQSLHAKYQRVKDSHDVLQQFATEAKRRWQWPKLYKAVAQSIESAGSTPSTDSARFPATRLGLAAVHATAEEMATRAVENAPDPNATPRVIPDEELIEEEFDLDAEWLALRRRHAEECTDFVMQHQKASLDYFSLLAKPEALLHELDQRAERWFIANGFCFNAAEIAPMKLRIRKFGEFVIRKELPAAKGKLLKRSEDDKKRERRSSSKRKLSSETWIFGNCWPLLASRQERCPSSH